MMRQQPDWLRRLARIKASGEVWEMRDAHGARIALIAGFSYPDGVDRSVFPFDIDACGSIEIAHAGVFDSVEQAAIAWRAMVGKTAQSAPPERIETAERLLCLVYCDSEKIFSGETNHGRCWITGSGRAAGSTISRMRCGSGECRCRRRGRCTTTSTQIRWQRRSPTGTCSGTVANSIRRP
jgi:hypothetical protein